MDGGVRFATIAPEGPLAPAQKNIPTPITTSCNGPAGMRKPIASRMKDARQNAIAVAHFYSRAFLLSRSARLPHTTMPRPVTSTNTASLIAALPVGIP